MTTIIIAEPIYKINIRYNEEIKNIEVLINEECKEYIVNIIDKDIPIPRFDLKTFYSLLHDILIKKKMNSKYNLNLKDNKCFLHYSMDLKDYLKTEYIFVLILKQLNNNKELKENNNKKKKFIKRDILKKEKELKENINKHNIFIKIIEKLLKLICLMFFIICFKLLCNK